MSMVRSSFYPVYVGCVKSAVVFVITDWLSYYTLRFWDGGDWNSFLRSFLSVNDMVISQWYDDVLYYVI